MSTAAPLPFVLASRSPQRRAILERLGIPFELRPTGTEELEHGDPHDVALQNALRKAQAAAGASDRPEAVLGVDTVVTRHRKIYGNPADEAAARATLEELSGRTHQVLGGLALVLPNETLTATAATRVTFRDLSPQTIDWYVGTGEWRERAGGYAIQGRGAVLVKAIEGDYENVVGLPLATRLDLYPALLRLAGAEAQPGAAPTG